MSRTLRLLLVTFVCAVRIAAAQDAVPPLMQVGGQLVDQKGRPLAGPQTVTFALYKEQAGDAPLWVERQVVTADAKGAFVALLGATSPTGVPVDLFSTGQARWLGMQADGQPEQPRTFLASVPYALAPLSATFRPSSSASISSAAPIDVPAAAGAPIFNITADSTSGLTSTSNGGSVTLTLIRSCATGQLLKWNGTSWGCTADTDVRIGVTGGGLNVLANGTSPNIVAGYGGNVITTGAMGATIAGGGESRPDGGLCPPFPAPCNANNRVAQSFGTVGGGENNLAGDNAGAASTRSYATVGGGRSNIASGVFSTVPGGSQNAALGAFSFAAGGNAKANHTGTFVWSDNSTSTPFTSTDVNQFLIHADRGVGINTNAPTQALDVFGSARASVDLIAGGRVCIGTDCRSSWPAGTVTGVTGGGGLSGGGTNGAVNLSVDFTATQRRVSGSCLTGNAIRTVNADGTVMCEPVVLTGGGIGGNLRITDDGLNMVLGDAASGRLKILGNVTSPNIVSGFAGNALATTSARGATISGGGDASAPNMADDYGTVGGGQGNTAGSFGTASGGGGNEATGSGATVGGGIVNAARASASTVGGGRQNVASGQWATVPGGSNNVASGAFSFAAGAKAEANSDGTFVWADVPIDPTFHVENPTPFSSTGPNQFLIRASGGVGIGTPSPTQQLDVAGNVKADKFIGDGSLLTNLPSGGGTITGVTANAGLAGGGTSGSVSLGVDFGATQKRVNGVCGIGTAMQAVNQDGTVDCAAVGGGIGGTGTPDALTKFLAGGVTVGNSRVTDNGIDIRLGDDASGRFSIFGNTISPNIVGGFKDNSVSGIDEFGPIVGATITGGGTADERYGRNAVGGRFGTVGGGAGNSAYMFATIGGGLRNTAGVDGSDYSLATVAGGSENSATGPWSTIGGGVANVASGSASVVPGGSENTASGSGSFAAGFKAVAKDYGAFVWSDGSSGVPFSSAASNQFLIRAIGGVGIGTNAPAEQLDVNGNVKAAKFIGDGSLLTNLPSGGGGTITGVTADAGLTGGGTSGSVTLGIENGGVTNAMLHDSTVTVSAGTGLSGGGVVPLGGTNALSVDFATTQKRVSGGCIGSGAIQTVNGDGTVGCVAVGGSGGIGGSGTQDALPKFLAGGTSLGNSRISDDGTKITLGDDTSVRLTISGYDYGPSIVAGFAGNTVSPGVEGATISGGGQPSNANSVTGYYGTVGGGLHNSAADYGSVSGGTQNKTNGSGASVGGGYSNRAINDFATVPGGRINTAAGIASLAAGSLAVAQHDGTFVWSSLSTEANHQPFASTAPSQFLIDAPGGVGIGTNSPGETLDVNGNVKAAKFIGDGSMLTGLNGGGTITGVTAGAGLIGGGTTGGVNLSVDFSAAQKRVSGSCGAGTAMQTVNGDGTVACAPTAAALGTPGRLSKFITATTLGDSLFFENPVNATVGVISLGTDGNAGNGIFYLQGTNGGPPNIIAGFQNNKALGGSGNTISGGGNSGSLNQTTGSFGTIGGGYANTAANGATIGGGSNNTAANGATVSGGQDNSANGLNSTIMGGNGNTTSGSHATVAGGDSNVAAGTYSFAAGRQAIANHNGAFVWGDSVGFDVTSSAVNEFTARATGGVRFISAVNGETPTAGVRLAPGAGAWSSLSDRNAKENFRSVDGAALLGRLNAMRIETWNYKSQDAAVRHIGPMAQDFAAAFAVGEDDTHISTVDADGVALAGVQALYRLLLEKDAVMQRQQAQIDQLRATVDELMKRLDGAGAKKQ